MSSAKYLRQSVLLTPYETPDTRSLYNSLSNVSGKIRTERRWSPVNVPAGVEPVRFLHNSYVFYLIFFDSVSSISKRPTRSTTQRNGSAISRHSSYHPSSSPPSKVPTSSSSFPLLSISSALKTFSANQLSSPTPSSQSPCNSTRSPGQI